MESNKKQIKFTNVPKTTTSKATKTTTNNTSKVTKVTTTSSTSSSTKPTKLPFQHTYNNSGMDMGNEFQKSANVLKSMINDYGNLDN